MTSYADVGYEDSANVTKIHSPWRQRWFWCIVGTMFVLKWSLINAYYSTDFEVHRNWMAITMRLPLSFWYFDETSQWTLDYPPFFAYFERLLGQIANYTVPSALVVQKEAFYSDQLLIFQRISVLACDIIFVFACVFMTEYIFPSGNCQKGGLLRSKMALLILLIANLPLLLIDNIHFQYNNILTAIWLFAVGFVARKHFFTGAIFYCVLLNMKHIYLYYAPAFVVFYLKSYLMVSMQKLFKKCLLLFIAISLPFALSLGPLIYEGGLNTFIQVFKRLFPFQRGLTHAYWAPNFWALYNFADFSIYRTLSFFKMVPLNAHKPQYTSGIVQEFEHSILPSVSPICALIATSVLLLPLMLSPPQRSNNFFLVLTQSAFAFFLFGYHVHEKAIILVAIPFTVLAVSDHRLLPSFEVLSLIANISLFPLFFTPFENLIKVSLAVCHFFFTKCVVRFLCPNHKRGSFKQLLIVGLVFVQFYCLILHQLLFGQKYEFFPLMITSVSAALGISVVYMDMLRITYFSDPEILCCK